MNDRLFRFSSLNGNTIFPVNMLRAEYATYNYTTDETLYTTPVTKKTAPDIAFNLFLTINNKQ